MHQTFDMRLSLLITRILAMTNGLEAFTATAALFWAVAVGLLSHDDSARAPIAILFVPYLAFTGCVSLMALWRGWRRVRTATSLFAFMGWGLQAALSWQEQSPGFAQTVGIYAALAVSELLLYVRTSLQLDMREKQVGQVLAHCVSKGKYDAGQPPRSY